MQKITYILAAICFAFSLRPALYAQTGERSLSLDAMISFALENNPAIKNASLAADKSVFAKRTSWDPGKTSFDWMRGQINTAATDNHFMIMQDLGTPLASASLSRLHREETKFYSVLKGKTEKEIARELSTAYNEWVYIATIDRIAALTQEYLNKASEYAQLQYQTGESNVLSKLFTQTKALEWQNFRKNLESRKSGLTNELMKLTFSETRVIPEDSVLTIEDDSFTSGLSDSTGYSSHELVLSKQLINIANSNLGYQRSGFTPSLRAGYFNQEIDRAAGFDGWQVGVGIPLWFFPQRSRVQMASIDKSIAENQYAMSKAELKYELETLQNKLSMLNEQIMMYSSGLLGHADSIQNSALKMYASGDIGYIEYIQNIISAANIRQDYWGLVRDHNQVVYRIEYYLHD